MIFSAHGKEVLRDGEHFADAVDEQIALAIVGAMHLTQFVHDKFDAGATFVMLRKVEDAPCSPDTRH